MSLTFAEHLLGLALCSTQLQAFRSLVDPLRKENPILLTRLGGNKAAFFTVLRKTPLHFGNPVIIGLSAHRQCSPSFHPGWITPCLCFGISSGVVFTMSTGLVLEAGSNNLVGSVSGGININ